MPDQLIQKSKEDREKNTNGKIIKKEPTNQDIMDALRRSRFVTLAALFCSTALAGLILALNGSSPKAQVYGFCLFGIGVLFFIWDVVWILRKK